MGFESFRIELRGTGLTSAEADQAMWTIPRVQADRQSIPMRGSSFYVLDDGLHVVEVELMDTPVRLSLRFTLCHPSSVDEVFLGLVRELMGRLGMKATICDDVRPEQPRSFSLDEFEEFSTVVSRSIAARREEWIAAFGTERLAATTNEVHERIILPLCQDEIGPRQNVTTGAAGG